MTEHDLRAQLAATTAKLAEVEKERDALLVAKTRLDPYIGAVRFAEARAAQDTSPGAFYNLGQARIALSDAMLGRTPVPAPDPRKEDGAPYAPIPSKTTAL